MNRQEIDNDNFIKKAVRTIMDFMITLAAIAGVGGIISFGIGCYAQLIDGHIWWWDRFLVNILINQPEYAAIIGYYVIPIAISSILIIGWGKIKNGIILSWLALITMTSYVVLVLVDKIILLYPEIDIDTLPDTPAILSILMFGWVIACLNSLPAICILLLRRLVYRLYRKWRH